MAIIKLSSKDSGSKAMLFFTDEGQAYVTSRKSIEMLLQGKWNGGFIHLSKLPIAVDPKRFKPSVVYDPVGNIAKTGKLGDGLSKKRQEWQKEVEQYTDKSIW